MEEGGGYRAEVSAIRDGGPAARGNAPGLVPDPWPPKGFLYNHSAPLPQENRLWLVTSAFIGIRKGDCGLEHTPQGRHRASLPLELQGDSTRRMSGE